MKDVITLPRETVQQALKALEYDDTETIAHCEVRHALRTALAAPAHTAHPMRHWDRTCPACQAAPVAQKVEPRKPMFEVRFEEQSQQTSPAMQKEEPDALGLFHNQAHTDLGPATRLKAAPAAPKPQSSFEAEAALVAQRKAFMGSR